MIRPQPTVFAPGEKSNTRFVVAMGSLYFAAVAGTFAYVARHPKAVDGDAGPAVSAAQKAMPRP
jgi:hypothetical protein